MVRCYRVLFFIVNRTVVAATNTLRNLRLDQSKVSNSISCALSFFYLNFKKNFDKIDTRRNQSCIKGRNKINNRPSNLLENVRERRRKSRIVRFRDLELVYLHVCGSGKNSRSYSWINNLRVEWIFSLPISFELWEIFAIRVTNVRLNLEFKI